MGVGIEACLPPGPAGSGVDSRALGDKTPAHRELGPRGGDMAILSCRSAQHWSQPCLCGVRSEADVPAGMEDIWTAEHRACSEVSAPRCSASFQGRESSGRGFSSQLRRHPE